MNAHAYIRMAWYYMRWCREAYDGVQAEECSNIHVVLVVNQRDVQVSEDASFRCINRFLSGA